MTRILIALLATAFAFSGCGSSKNTKLTASMSREGFQARPYQKLAVIVMSPKLNNRAIVEQDLAVTFATKGIKSIPTYDIFPFAGDRQMAENLLLTFWMIPMNLKHMLGNVSMITILTHYL